MAAHNPLKAGQKINREVLQWKKKIHIYNNESNNANNSANNVNNNESDNKDNGGEKMNDIPKTGEEIKVMISLGMVFMSFLGCIMLFLLRKNKLYKFLMKKG